MTLWVRNQKPCQQPLAVPGSQGGGGSRGGGGGCEGCGCLPPLPSLIYTHIQGACLENSNEAEREGGRQNPT